MLNQFRERKLEVSAVLAQLCEIARATGAETLASRLDREMIQKLEADRFHLVVVGEFNHGKTTFVNALLGADVLPVGVTPTTAVIHHLVYSKEPAATVVTESGDRSDLPFDELKTFSSGGDREAEAVRYIEVGYPAGLLEERVVLVDTPGVNDLSLQRAEITFDYIPRSDAVLFLLDAGQPIKESERQFLEKQLIGQSRDKIVFVVGKTDIWSEGERDEALSYVRDQLGSLINDPKVFAVSAQAALGGRRAESGIDELVDHLTRFLAEERGRIVLDNALGEGLRSAEVLGRGIDARRRAATMTAEDLGRRIALLEKDLAGHAGTVEKRRITIREEAAAIKAWASRDLDRFVDDVVRQLPAQLETASGDEIKTHLAGFLEATFKEWAQAETHEIANALEKLAEKTVALVREDAHDVGKRVGDAMGTDMKPPAVEVDTLPYDVGIFAMFTLGLGVVFANALLGGILLLGAPALAVWVRERTESEIRKRALELAPAALREASAKVAPKISEMVDQFADRLDQFVVAAGEELHREVIEVLDRARRDRTAGEADSEAILAACDRDAERLLEVRGRFDALRSSLWAPAETSEVEEPPAGANGSSGAATPAAPKPDGGTRGASDGS